LKEQIKKLRKRRERDLTRLQQAKKLIRKSKKKKGNRQENNDL
jgi:hypothetical protein